MLLDTPEGPVKPAIRNKRKRMQMSVIFNLDNACPHIGAFMMTSIQKFKWNLLPHLHTVWTLYPQTITSMARIFSRGRKKLAIMRL